MLQSQLRGSRMTSTRITKVLALCPLCGQRLETMPGRPVCGCVMTDGEAARDYQARFVDGDLWQHLRSLERRHAALNSQEAIGL